jgi:hypothetical protein
MECESLLSLFGMEGHTSTYKAPASQLHSKRFARKSAKGLSCALAVAAG